MKGRRGFTLIEIIIAIGLLGILLAIGIVSFNNYLRTQKLNNTAQALADDIKRASELTRAYGITTPTEEIQHIVIMRLSSNAYQIINQSTGQLVKSVVIPQGLTITTSFGPILAFNQSGRIDFPSISSAVKGTIQVSDGKASAWVTVEGLGLVSVTKFSPGIATSPITGGGTVATTGGGGTTGGGSTGGGTSGGGGTTGGTTGGTSGGGTASTPSPTKTETPFTGIKDGKYYQDGSLFTGTKDGKIYQDGVLFSGTKDGKIYKDGSLFSGTKDGKLYQDGALFSGTKDGKIYQDGTLFSGTKDGKIYQDGVIFSGTKDGKIYKDGNLYTGWKDNKQGTIYYTNGEPANGAVKIPTTYSYDFYRYNPQTGKYERTTGTNTYDNKWNFVNGVPSAGVASYSGTWSNGQKYIAVTIYGSNGQWTSEHYYYPELFGGTVTPDGQGGYIARWSNDKPAVHFYSNGTVKTIQ